MPFSFRNTRLKLRMVPKPHCSATWVMGRLLPCSSAAAWLMRYWLINPEAGVQAVVEVGRKIGVIISKIACHLFQRQGVV